MIDHIPKLPPKMRDLFAKLDYDVHNSFFLPQTKTGQKELLLSRLYEDKKDRKKKKILEKVIELEKKKNIEKYKQLVIDNKSLFD